MKICQYDARRFFLLAVRVFFGLWLLYAGLVKWFAIGPETFVGYITSEFDKTWSPHHLNVALAWLIIIAEPVLSVFVLIGKRERSAWTLMSLLMFLLTMGQTILMKPDVMGNWLYLLLCVVCASLSDPEKK